MSAAEQKVRVGIDSVYVATVTADSSSAYTTGTPQALAPVASASLEPSSSLETLYFDDQPADVLAAEGDTKISLELSGVDPATLALILGKVFDSTTGRLYDNGGTPPDCALGFRSLKSNGSYKYYWFLKGKFSPPKEEFSTKGEKAEAKTTTLEFTAVRTTKTFVLSGSVTDSVKRVVGDTDTTNFSATGWFGQVQYPAVASYSALALSSSSPTGGASGVAVTATLTLTFNNALATGEEFDCTLVNSATGAVVAGTNTIDTARKVVTVGHTSNLAAATLHRIVYSVKDIYGQTLTGVVSFTTS